jgi:hypothetical protein
VLLQAQVLNTRFSNNNNAERIKRVSNVKAKVMSFNCLCKRMHIMTVSKEFR